MEKLFIGIYVRESRDENGENYETIETQRDLLVEYVKKNGLGEGFRIYVDDNVSGAGFERPGIKQLKEDVMSGRINLLAIKDLSRLGRNNARTLLFLDFLEEYGVRVVTSDGRYDSLKDNDTVGIETWFNERYIRDISRKIRTNIRFKIERGDYIGHAPYGYVKSEVHKNRLCIDHNTAPIIKEIFTLYKEGYGYDYIAKHLNSKRYPSPSGAKWNPVAVQRILTSRVYVGDTVQGVSEKISFKSKKTRRLPSNKWVITNNTHEGIISEEEFEEVQRIRESKVRGKGVHKGTIHLLKSLMYCGSCGSAMFARVRKGRPMGYICGNYAKNGKSACSSHYISEKAVIDVIIGELIGMFEDEETRHRVGAMIDKEFASRESNTSEIARLMQQLATKQRQQDVLYMDKLEGKISEQLFVRMNSGLEGRIGQLQEEIERLRSQEGDGISGEEVIRQMLEDIRLTGITHEMVTAIVERVVVTQVGDGS